MAEQSVVLLQARTTSSRLPAKVLLPVAGIPLAVLAARRAANTGRPVLVVTSEERSDDALAKMLEQHGVRFFRGSLNDVLGRFVAALERYGDHTRVFRLTADNVFPDGPLLDQMERLYIEQNQAYLSCPEDDTGLPKGVSVELMRLEHLRLAAEKACSEYDREHVTPWIRRQLGVTAFSAYRHLHMDDYRCTVDTLDDYLAVQALFEDMQEQDAIAIPFLHLLQRLSPGADGSVHQPEAA
jgi:spore coat polysaccharide biosynthesis protein SpsF